MDASYRAGSETQAHLVLFDVDRFDHDELAHRSLVEKLDATGDLGKQRIVLAAAHVEARLHARAALPNDDGSARHQLSAESFEPEPLGVRIAPVS